MEGYKLVDAYGQPLNPGSQIVTQVFAVRHEKETGRQWLMEWPENHMQPLGCLRYCVESAALWQFMRQAHMVLREVPSQVSIEGDEDMHVSLRAVADSVCIRYAVKIEDMFSTIRMVELDQELLRIGGAIDLRIRRFIESGGQVYNEYDREPDVQS